MTTSTSLKISPYIYFISFLLNEMPDFIHPSFDYENAGYQAADLIKMDILLNGRPVEELATIVHRYCFIFHSILYPYIFSGNITCCLGRSYSFSQQSAVAKLFSLP